MSRVRVSFDVLIPDVAATVSDQQIKEWLRFELNDNGELPAENPLCDRAVEPIFGTFDWRWITRDGGKGRSGSTGEETAGVVSREPRSQESEGER